MPARAVVTALIASLLLTAAAASAQEARNEQEKTVYGDLIFDVPVNLTKLSPSITKVAVECNVKGAGISSATATGAKDTSVKRVEVPVTGGRVVGSLQVVFPASQTAGIKAGTAISYECGLTGLSADTKQDRGGSAKQDTSWKAFDPRNGAAFTLSETPKAIVGNFKW